MIIYMVASGGTKRGLWRIPSSRSFTLFYLETLELGRLVSESACERKDPGSNPAADMVDAARNTAWDLGIQPNNYQRNYPTQEWARSPQFAVPPVSAASRVFRLPSPAPPPSLAQAYSKQQRQQRNKKNKSSSQTAPNSPLRQLSLATPPPLLRRAPATLFHRLLFIKVFTSINRSSLSSL
ncbi:hypothetical protein FHG87_003387 [Trinorchestia longiramus]|nr:hypothetical protein FHG87_003387 [Trinorchestia longiramus]